MAKLTVEAASTTYVSAMRNVQPAGPGICEICKTFIEPNGFPTCYPCGQKQPNHLAAVVPISYSEHGGQLHTALWAYKNSVQQVQRYAKPRLAAILWRFLDQHETCIADAAAIPGFDLVTTVPSSMPDDDEKRPSLRTIVTWCRPIADRFQRVLTATGNAAPGREYDEARYTATTDAEGRNILLVDDTWTGGGHAQSAAHALRQAGGASVSLVVIGRHFRRNWNVTELETAGDLFDALPKSFDWDSCAVHAEPQ